MQFHVARALKLLVDDIVHTAARIHQRSGQYRQAASVFDIARGAKESFGPVERARVQTAGERAPCRLYGQVIRPRQARDGVQQDHHVLSLLHAALRVF